MKHVTCYREPRCCACGKDQDGLILIEVLIAGLILVLGIGGLAVTQKAALKSFTNAETASQLVDFHGSIVDRLRLHPDAARNGDFNIEHSGDSESRPDNSDAKEYRLVQDILAALSNNGARYYVKIQCESPGSSQCLVCIGLSAATISGSRTTNPQPPTNKLCSQQRIL